MLSGFEGLSAMVSVGNRLVFVNNDGVTGTELWVSDGTLGGTENVNLGVEDEENPLVDSFPDNLTVAGNFVFFTATDINAEIQLYVTDGTVAGTERLTDSLSQDVIPANFMAGNNGAYFQAAGATGGAELWFSDGTAAGTSMVADVNPGAASSDPIPIAVDGNTLYFSADDGTTGRELWKTDGTAAGTTLVADIETGADSSSPGGGTVAGGRLYFVASTPASGREIWSSDGTSAGTILLKDIAAGAADSVVDTVIAAANGTSVLFHADDGSGRLPWVSDGTEVGTVPLPGAATGLGFDDTARLGDGLILSGENSSVGFELFKVSGPSQPAILFETSTSTSLESDGTASIVVNLSEAVESDVEFEIAVGGAAREDLEYLVPSSVLIPAGETRVTVEIPLIDDEWHESDKDLTLTIPAIDGLRLGAVPMHTLTIESEDPIPRISLATTGMAVQQIAESDEPAIVSLRLDRPSETPVLAQLAISGTATVDEDYELSATTFNIPAGVTSQNFVFTPIDDSIAEGAERAELGLLFAALSTGEDLALDPAGNAAQIFVIPGNDTPIVQFVSPSAEIIEGGQLSVEVSITNPAEEDLAVPIAVQIDGPNGVVVDFNANTSPTDGGPLIIPAGQTSATIIVGAVDDFTPELATSVSLTIEHSEDYQVGSVGNMQIPVIDDDYVYVTLGPSKFVSEGGQNILDVVLSRTVDFDVTVPVSTSGTVSAINTSRPLGLPVREDELAFISTAARRNYRDIATPIEDFTIDVTSVTIPAGQLSVPITISAIDDNNHDPNEIATVRIGTPTEGARLHSKVIPGREDAIYRSLVILDDDPLVSVRSGHHTIGEGDVSNFIFRLAAPFSEDVSIPFQLGGTATNGVDYGKRVAGGAIVPFTSDDFVVVIPAGQTSGAIVIYGIDDTRNERDELLTLTLGEPSSGTVDDENQSASIRLYDNDEEVTVRWVTNTETVFARGQTHRVDLLLSRPFEEDTRVYFHASWSSRRVYGALGYSRTIRNASARNTSFFSGRMSILVPAGKRQFTYDVYVTRNYPGTYDTSYSIRITDRPGDPYDTKGSASYKLTIRDPSDVDPPSGHSRGSGFGLVGFETVAAAEGRSQSVNPFQIITPRSVVNPRNFSSSAGSSFNTGTAIPITQSLSGGLASPGQLMLPIGVSRGPLSNVQVFFDANFNGVADFLDLNNNGQQEPNEPDEPYSELNSGGFGGIALSSEFDLNADGIVDSSEGQFVGVGGTDIMTETDSEIRLTAPPDFHMLTELTTVISSLVRQYGYDPIEAMLRLQDATETLGFDPRLAHPLFEAVEGNEDAARSYVVQVQIQALVTHVASFLHGKLPTAAIDDLGQVVFSEIAGRIAVANSRFDLTNNAGMADIARSSATALGLSVDATTIAGLGDIIAATNVRYSQVPLTNDDAFGQAIGKVKSVVFHQSRDLLESVGNNTISIAAALNSLTGATLDAAIDQGIVHQVTPALLIPYDARLLEGDSENTLDFNIELLGTPPGGASVNYTIFNETATGEIEEPVAEGTVVWEDGTESIQTVSVPIVGDTEFQGDQVYVLHLSDEVGAAIRLSGGAGYVFNDDVLTFTAAENTESTSTVKLTLNGTSVTLEENSQHVLSGDLHFDSEFQLAGLDDQDHSFIIDHSNRPDRSDSVSIAGGSGLDDVEIYGGEFLTVHHEFPSSEQSQTTFVDLAGKTLDVTLTGVETYRILPATTEQLTVQLPDGDFSFVIEDADPTGENGRLDGFTQIREIDSLVATVVITSPSALLRVTAGVGNSEIDVQAVDPSFSGTLIVENADTAAPVSDVRPVASVSNAVFDVVVDFEDTVNAWQTVSGISTVEVFYLVNPLTESNEPRLLTTISPEPGATQGSVTTTFATFDHGVQSGDVVQLWSVATDVAGNRQGDSVRIDASTVIADTAAPQTQVVSATFDGNQQVDLVFTGVDIGGGVVESFDVFVEIDPGTASADIQLLATVNGGDASEGIFSGTFSYPVIKDGTAHSYRFFTIGTDQKANREGGAGALVV